MEKKCLDCGEILMGRSDKKFCSDYCRSNYYNKHHSETKKNITRINKILKKNHTVLSDLNPAGKSTMHRDVLLAKGFNFKYFTNTYTTKAGATYYFCYEQGYLPIDNNFYALVTRQEKTDKKE